MTGCMTGFVIIGFIPCPPSRQTKLQALATALGLPLPRCVELVLREPVLLTLSTERLEGTLTELAAALHVPLPGGGNGGSSSPGPLSDLARLVVSEPHLLLEGTAVVAGRVADAAELLALPEAAAASMVMRSPGFIQKDFRCDVSSFQLP